MILRFALLLLLTTACGSRTGLSIEETVATPIDGGIVPVQCPPLPPIPEEPSLPLGAACAFSPDIDNNLAVMVAVADQDLVALTPQATLVPWFHFAQSGTWEPLVYSRGDYVGAMVRTASRTGIDVELVLFDRRGRMLAHHSETLTGDSFGGGGSIVGNAAGTFAFHAGVGWTSRIWIIIADGTMFPPIDGYSMDSHAINSLEIEPDARARFLARPVMSNSSADVYWIDPCAGSATPVSPSPWEMAGWGDRLFEVDMRNQFSSQTADAITPLALAALDPMAQVLDFVPPGIALFGAPPYGDFPNAITHFRVVDAGALTERALDLELGGRSWVTTESWISEIGASNNPAGFGIDSHGRLTFFLTEPSGLVRLYASADGSNWTPIGEAIDYDHGFDPSYSLAYAEAGGTYLIEGMLPSQPERWQVVRPESGVSIAFPGHGQVARDGGCVSALVGDQLAIASAVTGVITSITLPMSVDPHHSAATWIPGDDAVLSTYY